MVQLVGTGSIRRIYMLTPGTALEMIRRENNMTQEEVAKYLGISRNTLAAYESGKQKVPLTVFIYLADLYNCDVYDILSVHASDIEFDTDEKELIKIHARYKVREAKEIDKKLNITRAQDFYKMIYIKAIKEKTET